jgi:hypothetical protein
MTIGQLSDTVDQVTIIGELDEEVADSLEAAHQAAQIGRSSAHTVHDITD